MGLGVRAGPPKMLTIQHPTTPPLPEEIPCYATDTVMHVALILVALKYYKCYNPFAGGGSL